MNSKLSQKVDWGRRQAFKRQLSPAAAGMMVFLCYAANYETGLVQLNYDVVELMDPRFIEDVAAAMGGSCDDLEAACNACLLEYWRVYMDAIRA